MCAGTVSRALSPAGRPSETSWSEDRKAATMPKRSDHDPVAAEHRTVTRAVAIMELVAVGEPGGVRLGALAGPLGAPKSSIHGLAKGLVAVGYLREQDGRY